MTTETAANRRLDIDTAAETARRLDELSALVQAQQGQIEGQRTQIEALSARLEKPIQPRRLNQEQRLSQSERQRNAPGGPEPTGGMVRSATRRDLFKLGGAAVGAAGLAALTGIQRPQPADAAYTIYGGGISAADGETVIKAGTGTGNPPEPTFSGNDSILLLDASSNPQANTDLRGLHAYGSGTFPGVESIGGAASGSGVTGIGGNSGGVGVTGLGAGSPLGRFASAAGVAGRGGAFSGAGGYFLGGPNGIGVIARGGDSNGIGAALTGAGTAAPLSLTPSSTQGPPGAGTRYRGEVMVDSTGTFWFCISYGTPGTWVPIQPGQGSTPGSNVFYRAVTTTYRTLASSDGVTWMDMDSSNLTLTITPAFKCLAVLNGNCDLWTDTAGYNQDIGITVSGGVYPSTANQPEVWKESGGFAGTFSPNAALVQTAVPLLAGTAYTIKLQWKTNRNAPGATIYAGAGPIGGKWSPTSLTAYLIPTP